VSAPQRAPQSPPNASFVALYRGPTITEARLIAVSADPAVVARVAAQLLRSIAGATDAPEPDPVLGAFERGRRRALHHVVREARDARPDAREDDRGPDQRRGPEAHEPGGGRP
jgi:hypothetical protein